MSSRSPSAGCAKDFIKIEGPKSITVAGRPTRRTGRVTRESATAEWKLADAKPEEKLDTGKTSSLGSIFSAPSFTDVLAPDAKPEETGLDKPTARPSRRSTASRYELKIGKAERRQSIPCSVAVSANFPKERTPGKDEKPEDKTRLDEEFAAKQKQLEEKLAKEKKFEGRAYLVAEVHRRAAAQGPRRPPRRQTHGTQQNRHAVALQHHSPGQRYHPANDGAESWNSRCNPIRSNAPCVG